MTRRSARLIVLAVALGATVLIATPIALGYLEGPRFPVAGPGPWEALKQIGHEWRFRP